MKVNIYETIEVSDEQRVEIARKIDDNGAKKRQATRDEIKAYVWEHGSGWAEDLAGVSRDEDDGVKDPGVDDDEDLLGTDDDEDLI